MANATDLHLRNIHVVIFLYYHLLSNICVCKPTKLFDKLLHMEVEGVDDGASRFVVVVIDGYGGKATSNLSLLKHVHLNFRAEMLPQEVGRGTASYACPNHRCNSVCYILI